MKARIITNFGGIVNIRSEANTSSPVIERIRKGMIVDVVDRGEEWSQILFDEKTGYVINQFIVFGEKD